MQEIFRLVGRIAIDNAEANKAIDDTKEKAADLGREIGGAGTSADTFSEKINEKSKLGTAAVFMGNMLTNMALAAGEFVTNLAKSGIGLASELEQNMGGVETLFGDAAETVFENADKAYQTAGVSANKYMQTVTAFAAALKRSVETEADAARIADMAIIDMSDNANKMGTDMTSIQNAYQGFAKQNFTMLDNLKLGYGGTKEEMERLLADAGKLADQEYDISSLSDIFEAVHVIQQEMGIAGTTAEEAATTLAGSSASAKAFWENFQADTMLNVIPKLTEAIGKVMSTIENNPETIQKISDAISSISSVTIGAVTGFLSFIIDNGKPIGIALATIAAGLAAGAVAAHPFAAAIMAVAAGLAWLTSEEGKQKRTYDHFFDGHSQEAMAALQEWVEAKRAVKEADDTYRMNVSDEEFYALMDAADAAAQKVNALDGDLIGLYNTWRSGQENGFEFLDVPVRVSEESEANMQKKMDGMTLEAMAKIHPDLSEVYAAQNQALTFYANVVPNTTGTPSVNWNADGAVFSKPTIFNTRYGLQGVGEAGPEFVSPVNVLQRYVSDAVASQNAGMVSVLQNMLTALNQINANTASGHQVVLDTGVLAGQMAPALDVKLGTISSRKGRRN